MRRIPAGDDQDEDTARVAGLQHGPAERGEGKRQRSTHLGLVGLTVVGYAIPLVIYLWFIDRYGVNVIWGDQWADVNVIRHSFDGTLSLSALWAQHNEARIFFPNLIVVVLAHTTHFNLFAEMYLSAALLCAATAVLILTHRRRAPSAPWIFYCPVAIMLLSLVQYGDTLWGFQVAWYLVLLALAVSLLLLDRPTLSWLLLMGAMAVAVIGSFSLFQGLLIWPIGVLLMFQRKRRPSMVATWVCVGVATTTVYFDHFNLRVPGVEGQLGMDHDFALHHPATFLKFFFTVIGDVIGVGIPNQGNVAILALGIGIVAISVWIVIAFGLRRDEDGPRPLGVSLICFGLLYALFLAAGRAPYGLNFAGVSVYSLDNLLLLVGGYLAVFGSQWTTDSLQEGRRPARQGVNARAVVIRALLALVIALQVVLGFVNGLAGGSAKHTTLLATEDVVANISAAPNDAVFDIYLVGTPATVREAVPFLRRHHLTFFASATGRREHLNEGLFLGSWAGAQAYPVEPWRGLRNGEAVVVSTQRPHGDTGPFLVTECNPRVLDGNSNACETTHEVRMRCPSERAPFGYIRRHHWHGR